MVDRWFQRLPPRGRSLRSAAFRRLYTRAITDVLTCLDGAGVTYWVTEGTLIQLLRFGRNHPPETGLPVDHDVDIMVELSDPSWWPDVSAVIAGGLVGRGWSPEPLTSTSHRPGARMDKLRCWLTGPGFARTRCDIHSYVADHGSGVGWSHGDADSYPFQRWGGFVPLDLIHPLGVCACYAGVAPAPRDPVAVLRGWNDGEYDRPCLALPRRGATKRQIALIVEYAHRLDARGAMSFLAELRRCGLVGSP